MSKEKVLLVVIDLNRRDSWPVEDISQEMRQLVEACGGEVIDQVVCRPRTLTAAYLITEGKVNEVAEACSLNQVDTVIFSQDLKGSQQRNIEEIVKVRIIDRTQLILDIFARHASSMEGKMQVELAQLEYMLPRLVGKSPELSRLGGGIGTLGPGETKLEVDRRRIADRIARLKKGLEDVSSDRKLKRKKRKDRQIPAISLVGYTNAGKSSLLNALTSAGQKTLDGLFTTLDSLSRQYVLPNNQTIILSDTVGFMHELPHRLIESFKATLEEVNEADLLLHVLDVSHPRFRYLYEAVCDVLKELDASEKPTIMVLNKIDKVADRAWLAEIQSSFEHAICLSAQTGENLSLLITKICEVLQPTVKEVELKIPMNRMDLVNSIHKEGRVHSFEYHADFIHISAVIPIKSLKRFAPYLSAVSKGEAA